MNRLASSALLLLSLGGCGRTAGPARPEPPAAAPSGPQIAPAPLPAAGRSSPGAEDPLSRPVSFDWRGVPFRGAARTLSRLGGVPVTWEPTLPAAILDRPVTLAVSGMPLRRACAWLGRLADLEAAEVPDPEGPGEGGIRFGAPDESPPESGPWALSRLDVGSLVTPPPPPDLAVQRLGSYDRLMGRTAIPPPAPAARPGEKPRRVAALGPDPSPGMLGEIDQALQADRADRARGRREAMSALLAVLKPLAYASYDHPRPCHPFPGSQDQLLVDQPVRGRPWVRDAVEALASPEPPSGLADPEAVEGQDARWALPVTLPRGEVETAEALRDLARQAGMNLGWDARELAGAVLRRITLPGGRSPFGEALSAVARRAGFTRVLREPGAGVWLMGPREAARPSRGRWEASCTLGAYPVADLDGRMGAETVLGLLRSRLEGDPWKEPGAVLAYYPAVKRILVRHRPEVHLEVHALLAVLRREGEDPFRASAR